MNHAYGIKKYILKEEAELPSAGYNDVVTVSFLSLIFKLMGNLTGENFLPWLSRGKELKIRTPDEMKLSILSAPEVKEVIADLVRERTKEF